MVGLTFLHIAHGFACGILIDFIFFLVWDGNVQSVATALLQFWHGSVVRDKQWVQQWYGITILSLGSFVNVETNERNSSVIASDCPTNHVLPD